MSLKRRGRAEIWAILLAGCLAALLASTTGAAPLPHALSDAPWGADVRVDDDPGTAVQESPAIAVDPNGNAYAVWEDWRNGNGDIYFSYRPAGGNWGPNAMVNDGGVAGAADQESPAIPMDPNGNAYAVFGDWRNGKYAIYFSYRPAGGNWKTNVMVNDGADRLSQDGASIAVDPWGNAFAVWAGDKFIVPGPPFVYYTVEADYRPAGGNWGTDVTVSDVTRGRPDVAVDPNGNAYAVFGDWRNGNDDIYFSYLPAGGNWGLDAMVNDGGVAGAADQESPAIAVDPNGNAYAVFGDWRNGKNAIYFSYRPAGGNWKTDFLVNDGADHLSQDGASIAVDPCGNAFAVWAGDKFIVPSPPFVYYMVDADYRPAGGNWGTDVTVSDVTRGRPDIAVDPCGNAYAVWADWLEDEDWNIHFSYLPAPVSCCVVEEEFVPEPATILLFGSGLVGLAGYATLRWRTRE